MVEALLRAAMSGQHSYTRQCPADSRNSPSHPASEFHNQYPSSRTGLPPQVQVSLRYSGIWTLFVPVSPSNAIRGVSPLATVGWKVPRVWSCHCSRPTESLLLQLAKSEVSQLLPARALVSMAPLFSTARREQASPAPQIERRWLKKFSAFPIASLCWHRRLRLASSGR